MEIFKKLFEQYQESGLNVQDFCANQDIGSSSFYYWKKKLIPSTGSVGFVPLVVNNSRQATAGQKTMIGIPDQSTEDTTDTVEFTFPNGVKCN